MMEGAITSENQLEMYTYYKVSHRKSKLLYTGSLHDCSGLWNGDFSEHYSLNYFNNEEGIQIIKHEDQSVLPQHEPIKHKIIGTLVPNDIEIRIFDSGASRNSDQGKLDYEGFLDPLVLEAYAEYMNKNRYLEDGSVRDSDNWQKGIPKDAYMKSMWRHFLDVWKNHRGHEAEETQITNLCAVMFNAMGMLHEMLKEKAEAEKLTE
jgi:hypothetical protein